MDVHDRLYRIVLELSDEHGVPVDGWQEDLVGVILEDNGEDLTDAEYREIAEDFFTDWEEWGD